MPTAPIRVAAARAIAAPPAVAYGVLANWRDGHHQAVLPPAFSDPEVVAGGIGAGTVGRVTLTVLGRARRFEFRLEEPEPGRVLLERAPATEAETRFVVDPDPAGCRVEIVTEQPASPGLAGRVERLPMPRLLGPIYADELARLDRYARARAAEEETPTAGA